MRRWHAKGLAFLLPSITVFTTLPVVCNQWLGQYLPIDATGLPL